MEAAGIRGHVQTERGLPRRLLLGSHWLQGEIGCLSGFSTSSQAGASVELWEAPGEGGKSADAPIRLLHVSHVSGSQAAPAQVPEVPRSPRTVRERLGGDLASRSTHLSKAR